METETTAPPKKNSGRTVTQTVITKEILPEDSGKRPEFWSYLEKLDDTEMRRHLIYIYRVEPRVTTYGDGESNIDKVYGERGLEMPDGRYIPINDREEFERGIGEKHGGKAFRLILKRGSERVTEGKISNDLPPIFRHNPIITSAPSVTPANEVSATADVAKAAMNAVANQEKQAVSIAVDALRSAGEMVRQLSSGGARTESTMDDALKTALVTVLNRALNPPPPPDPLDQLTKMFALFNQMRPPVPVTDPANPQNPTIAKFIDVAIDRALNPVSSTPPVNASAEFMRQLPAVAGYVSEAFREWRMGSEAQRDTAALMTQGGPPRPGQPTQPGRPAMQPARPLPATTLPPTTQPAPGPVAVPTPANGAQPMGIPSLEFVEAKIVEILSEDVSPEQAADDALAFLDRMDQRLVAQLYQAGESGLASLFQTRPVLRQASTNPERLAAFIRAFMKYAKESFDKPPADESAPEGNPA